jgi:hypothetical protein
MGDGDPDCLRQSLMHSEALANTSNAICLARPKSFLPLPSFGMAATGIKAA